MVVWLRNFLMDLGVVPRVQSAITLYCHNSRAVANSKEPRSYKRGKHIEMKYDKYIKVTFRPYNLDDINMFAYTNHALFIHFCVMHDI